MQKLILLLALLISVLGYGQTFEGHSTDDYNSYNCSLRINNDSSVNFIYDTPGNEIFGDHSGEIRQINDTLFHISAKLEMGQYFMKSYDMDTFYVQLDSAIARRLTKIEIEYTDNKTRKMYQGYDNGQGPIYSIKMPVDKNLFNAKKRLNHIKITVNWKNTITRHWVRFKIPFGSAAHFTNGEKLEFDIVIKNGELRTIGKPPLQTGHFILKELD